MNYYLGIDGGGTRTTAWLANEDGKVLARVETGPANPLKAGLRAAERELRRATCEAVRQAGLAAAAPVLSAVCAGIAGSSQPAVHGRLLSWMRQHLPAHHHMLTSDAAIALAAAVGDSPGIIVIAGTGSIALARDGHGRLLRAGGWGTPFDDCGSGYDVGRRAIAAALQAFDGRDRHTVLMDRICHALSLPDITHIVSRHFEPQQVAALFPLAMEAAQEGDRVARHLCEDAAGDLAHLAVALLKRTRWLHRSVPVVCAGGVFRSSLLIRRAFARQLRGCAPKVRVELLARLPVEGALRLAHECANAEHWNASLHAGTRRKSDSPIIV
jgi:N-acetylglucosamine kinase-like BadF-type ATPase